MQSNRAENILPKLTAQNDFFVTNWQLTGPLIGNQHSNSVIKEIYPQLPLKVNADYLKLNNKKYPGKALGYWLAIPNPQNPKQSILLIGGNDLSKVKYRKGIPAEDGCYEFEVVEYKGNEIEYQDWGWITEEKINQHIKQTQYECQLKGKIIKEVILGKSFFCGDME